MPKKLSENLKPIPRQETCFVRNASSRYHASALLFTPLSPFARVSIDICGTSGMPRIPQTERVKSLHQQLEQNRGYEDAKKLLQAAQADNRALSLRDALKDVANQFFLKKKRRLTLSLTTFTRRLNGGLTKIESANAREVMLPGETEALLDHLVTSAKRGFPLNRKSLKEAALGILEARLGGHAYLGKGWSTRFFRRHSGILRTHWGQTLDMKRGRAVNPATNETYFKLLKETLGVQEDGSQTILPENIYGCDESGFMQGVAETGRVIGLAGAGGQHVLRHINRETTTVLVTICADGTSLPPLVIFKGKHFQVSWNRNNPLGCRSVFASHLSTNDSPLCSLAHSENGWITQELGVGYLQTFIDETKEKCKGRTRVLLVDGHTSHCTYEFLKLAADNNIIILCYPPHATHVYQGLDVACFGTMKKYWHEACEAYESVANKRVSKAKFLEVFADPYRKAFTSDLIKSAFRRTGVVPYDPSVISPEMLAPSEATSFAALLPLTVPSAVAGVLDCARRLASKDKQSQPVSPEIAIDPVLLESDDDVSIARNLRTALSTSSESFIISSSPIRSSSTLTPFVPEIPFTSPDRHERMSKWGPFRSQEEEELWTMAQRAHIREKEARHLLDHNRAQMTIQSICLQKASLQLASQEDEAKKKKEKNTRFTTNGQAAILTNPHWIQLARNTKDAKAAAAAAAAKKKEEVKKKTGEESGIGTSESGVEEER